MSPLSLAGSQSHRPAFIITPMGSRGTCVDRLGVQSPHLPLHDEQSAYSFGPLPPTKCRSVFSMLAVLYKEQAGLKHAVDFRSKLIS